MKSFFLGNSTTALQCLLELSDEVVGVASPTEPPDRARVFGCAATLARGVDVRGFGPDEITRPEFLSTLKTLAPDLIVVAGFPKKIPAAVYRFPKYGAINFHPSLLPRYRGRHPINWAIIQGEKETGMSAHVLDDSFDTGPLIAQKRVSISAEDTAFDVYLKTQALIPEILRDVFHNHRAGGLKTTPQDLEVASHFPPRKPEDGAIRWQDSAWQIHHLIRALSTPYPGAFTQMGGQNVILWKSEPPRAFEKSYGIQKPGTLLDAGVGQGLWIQTGDGVLHVLRYQVGQVVYDLGSEPPFRAGEILGERIR